MNSNFKVENYYLDDNQMKLINTQKNSIVIAGAGSGKTLTIIGKVNHLIENKFANPEEILLISFTNASVNSLKSKIKYNVDVFTFHKLAIHILKTCKIDYRIAHPSLLNYVAKEYLQTCDSNKQKKILKFLNYNFSYNNFLKSSEFLSFCNLAITFINLFKTNGLTYEDVSKIKYSPLEKDILLIIFDIYKMYISEKNSVQSMDFDDLIIFATKYAQFSNLKYKYVIIDEFQDTSFLRLNLIKKIVDTFNSKIIVVGDDWQSIYHFSGCDLNLFLNFDKYFKGVIKIKLIETYRNSQELINIATKFILKNNHQIKKVLYSSKHSNQPIIFAPYTKPAVTIDNLLKEITKKSNDIMILSRNKKDILKYFESSKISENYIIFDNLKIPHYTVHKSKGLEAEFTIILNCNNEILGFPNKIEDNRIIAKLFPSLEIPFAEERRLFYVAITRSKNTSYIVYDQNNPSIFVKETKKIVKKELNFIPYFQK